MKKMSITMIICLLLIICGCEVSLEKINPFVQPPKPKKEIKVGVSMATMKEDVYEIMKKSIFENRDEEKIKIIWKNANNNLEQQEKDIKSLITDNVDIIIFHAVDTSEKGAKLVNFINKSNIPVVALDRLTQNVKVDAYISADNFKAGQLQARYLIDQLDKTGNIIILKGDKNTNVSKSITKGNMSELKKYMGINIVKDKFHEKWSKELSKKTIKSIIDLNKDFEGILANNDQLALGAIEILKKEKINKKMIVVGADASKEGAIAVAKEKLNATIDKMPYALAKNAIKVATFIARGEDWNWDRTIKNGEHNIKLVISPVKLIDKYNINSLEERWGRLPIKENKK
ncbi:substrate-binding domain-containing protein [Orenia marismortui]|uniref:substrate-binding domain-containing protein n=1 Tax=Orenia marismortui TaxID=46469 RepID=UPI000377DE97|nr:substrate-binding domain-containing protein [Orenia marismortui]